MMIGATTTTDSTIDKVLSTHYSCSIDVAFNKGTAAKSLLKFQKLSKRHSALMDKKIVEYWRRTFPLILKSK